jgi:hypothetical protein
MKHPLQHRTTKAYKEMLEEKAPITSIGRFLIEMLVMLILALLLTAPLFAQDWREDGKAVKPFIAGGFGKLNNTAVSLRAGFIACNWLQFEAAHTWSAVVPMQVHAKAGYIVNKNHRLQFVPAVGVAHYYNGQQSKENNYTSAIVAAELGWTLDGRNKSQEEIHHFVFFVDFNANVLSKTSSNYIGAFGLRIVFD